MTVVTAVLAGAALGARHAIEIDHVAAVATLVDGDASPRDAAGVGASWGVGHAVPVVALSLAFLALGVRLPGPVVHTIEGLVGVVLVVLGVQLLRRTLGSAEHVVHSHSPTGAHTHRRLGGDLLGRPVLLDGDTALVGIIHGVAGSGALVVALAATAPTLPVGIAFLAGFAVLSTLSMATVSLVWGRSLRGGGARPLQAIAGVFGVAVGLALLAEVVIGTAVL